QGHRRGSSEVIPSVQAANFRHVVSQSHVASFRSVAVVLSLVPVSRARAFSTSNERAWPS
ncbi:MAG: hypothetical protein ACRDGM_02250, partial [bacterium]